MGATKVLVSPHRGGSPLAKDLGSGCRIVPASHSESDHNNRPLESDLQAKESAQEILLQQEAAFKELSAQLERNKAAISAAVSQLLTKGADTAATESVPDLLNTLRARVTDPDAAAARDPLAVLEQVEGEWARREQEVRSEQENVRALANLFDSAVRDAHRLVAAANDRVAAELALARITLEEQRAKERSLVDDMRKEVQEARLIRLLHQRTGAIDLDHEIGGLRKQLEEKSAEVRKLRKEVLWFYDWQAGRAATPPLEDHPKGGQKLQKVHYVLEGSETVGRVLTVALQDPTGGVTPPSKCAIQWWRAPVGSSSSKELIQGATRAQYAPEPLDAGRALTVTLETPDGVVETVSTTGAVEQAPGLEKYVGALAAKGGADFSVRVMEVNDEEAVKPVVHVLEVGTRGLKLERGRKALAKGSYNEPMQICGARGGGETAACALFVQFPDGSSYTLSCESERERNAAIMLARQLAANNDALLLGPGDRASLDQFVLQAPPEAVATDMSSVKVGQLNGPGKVGKRFSFVFGSREKTGRSVAAPA